MNVSKLRPVVTGLGVLAANGTDLDSFWSSTVGGVPALAEASTWPQSGVIVGELPSGDHFSGLPRVRAALCDRSTLMAVAGAQKALENAGLFAGDFDPDRAGVILGTGVGNLITLEQEYEDLMIRGHKRPSPLAIPKIMPSSCASWVSMAFGLRGPAFAITSACASGSQAIGVAAQMITNGLADVMIAGGVEACLTNGILRAWASMGVLSSVCRPFAIDRNGIVLSEGVGILILESPEHAKARGKQPIAEIAGFGFSADAGEITAPNVDGMTRAMSAALASANLSPVDIDYVNAHGTGTKANDVAETKALKNIFGNAIPPTSSTKSVHGHALGASGGIEAIATILAMKHAIAPPTANFSQADPACELDCIANVARPMKIFSALSNSFAFGGINASVALVAC